MSKVTALDHVQIAIPVGQEQAARDFYGGILGLKELPKPTAQAQRGGVWFECGSLQLHLGVEGDFRPAKKAHPAFIVDDLAQLLKDVAAAGFPAGDVENLNQVDRAFTEDAFGNRIELVQPRHQASAAVMCRGDAVQTMVRAGTLDDVPAVDAFDLFGGDRKADAREGRLWVAVDAAGELAGYASVVRCPFHRNPYVEFLCVRPSSQRQGVASHLLDAIEHANPGRRMFISTEEPNQAMLELLARRGYKQSGALQGLNDSHSGAAEIFFYRDV